MRNAGLLVVGASYRAFLERPRDRLASEFIEGKVRAVRRQPVEFFDISGGTGFWRSAVAVSARKAVAIAAGGSGFR
jgi:hypothetical protein